MVDQHYFSAALAGNRRAHHAGGARADYGDIELVGHGWYKSEEAVIVSQSVSQSKQGSRISVSHNHGDGRKNYPALSS
jgi:hypothetical protein